MPREIIAILRGVQPDDVLAIGEALIGCGISTIEVPLTSPKAFESIARLAIKFADQAQIGAGTVLSVADVYRVADAGGTLIVSPDTFSDVIKATKMLGLASYPGVLSPTECFTALRNGADGLKIFPAHLVGAEGLKALSTVLLKGTKTYAVGGVGPNNFQEWLEAGVTGFGIGSSLYQAGMSVQEVTQKATSIVIAYDRALEILNSR